MLPHESEESTSIISTSVLLSTPDEISPHRRLKNPHPRSLRPVPEAGFRSAPFSSYQERPGAVNAVRHRRRDRVDVRPAVEPNQGEPRIRATLVVTVTGKEPLLIESGDLQMFIGAERVPGDPPPGRRRRDTSWTAVGPFATTME